LIVTGIIGDLAGTPTSAGVGANITRAPPGTPSGFPRIDYMAHIGGFNNEDRLVFNAGSGFEISRMTVVVSPTGQPLVTTPVVIGTWQTDLSGTILFRAQYTDETRQTLEIQFIVTRVVHQIFFLADTVRKNYLITFENLQGTTMWPITYNVQTPTFDLDPPVPAYYTDGEGIEWRFQGWRLVSIDERPQPSNGFTTVIPQGTTGDRLYRAYWEKNTFTVTLMRCTIEHPILDTRYIINFEPEVTLPDAISLSELVQRGNSSTFTVDIQPGWEKAPNFAILVNNEPRFFTEGEHIIPNIQQDKIVTVRGLIRKVYNITNDTGPGYLITPRNSSTPPLDIRQVHHNGYFYFYFKVLDGWYLKHNILDVLSLHTTPEAGVFQQIGPSVDGLYLIKLHTIVNHAHISVLDGTIGLKEYPVTHCCGEDQPCCDTAYRILYDNNSYILVNTEPFTQGGLQFSPVSITHGNNFVFQLEIQRGYIVEDTTRGITVNINHTDREPTDIFIPNLEQLNTQVHTNRIYAEYTIFDIRDAQHIRVTGLVLKTYQVTDPNPHESRTVTNVPATVDYNQNFTFEVIISEGWQEASPGSLVVTWRTVGTTAETVIPRSGTVPNGFAYSMNNVLSDREILVTGLVRKSWNVNMQPRPWNQYSVHQVNNPSILLENDYTVQNGDDFHFQITLNSGALTYIIVRVNNVPLNPTSIQDMGTHELLTFSILNITENKQVRYQESSLREFDVFLTPGPEYFYTDIGGATLSTEGAANATKIEWDGSFTFRVLPSHTRYDLSQIVVTSNDAVITPVDGVYTITNIRYTQTVQVVGAEIYHFDIELIQGTGYTIEPTQGSESPVMYDGSYNFTVSLSPGFLSSTFTVYVNDASISTTDGIYRITNIREHKTVRVELAGVDRFPIVLPTGHGYIATPIQDAHFNASPGWSLVSGTPTADYNASFTFSVAVATTHNLEELRVRNGNLLLSPISISGRVVTYQIDQIGVNGNTPNISISVIGNYMNVIFDSDIATQRVMYGNLATKPEPTREGYEFVRWIDTYTGTEFDFNTPITRDYTLSSEWTQQTYTVTFELRFPNGTYARSLQTLSNIPFGGMITPISVNLENIPEARGHTFGGWFSTPFTVPFDFHLPMPGRNVIVFGLLQVDKSQLRIALTQAREAIHPDDRDWYTVASRIDLEQAITFGSNVYTSPSATIQEVATAIDSLHQARLNLQLSAERLQLLIDRDHPRRLYTVASWTIYKEAHDRAVSYVSTGQQNWTLTGLKDRYYPLRSAIGPPPGLVRNNQLGLWDKNKLFDLLELTESILDNSNTDFTLISAQQVNIQRIIDTIDNISPTLTQQQIDDVYNQESIKLQINRAKFSSERDLIMREVGPSNTYTTDTFRALMEALLDTNRNINEDNATLEYRLAQIDTIRNSLSELRDARDNLRYRDQGRAGIDPAILGLSIAAIIFLIFLTICTILYIRNKRRRALTLD
jgi:hypothetical protein